MKNAIGCCIPGGSYVPGIEGGSDLSDRAEALIKTYGELRARKYDFAESTAGALEALSDKEFDTLSRAHKEGRFTVYAVNSLLPERLGLFSANKDSERKAYIKKVMKRLAAVGGKYTVFGSGRARSVPNGIKQEATSGCPAELKDFLLLCDSEAAENGMRFLIEPLNRNETNLILTLEAAAECIYANRLLNTALVCDSYHYYSEEPESRFPEENTELIGHVHLSEYPSRSYPSFDGGEKVASLIKRLLTAGYKGAFSVECKMNDYYRDAASAYNFITEEIARYERSGASA